MKAEVNIRYDWRLPDGREGAFDCFCNRLQLRDGQVFFVPCSLEVGYLALDAPCDVIEGLLSHKAPDDIVSCHVQLFVEGMPSMIQLPVTPDKAKCIAAKFIAATAAWIAQAPGVSVAVENISHG